MVGLKIMLFHFQITHTHREPNDVQNRTPQFRIPVEWPNWTKWSEILKGWSKSNQSHC